jgi:hypothetical protein
MPPEEKRIVIRVETGKWVAFDDRRHAERTTFQDLGLRLFETWLGGDQIIPAMSDKKHEKRDIVPKSTGILTVTEDRWTRVLVAIFRSGNEVAVRAIQNNLLTFLDYVSVVPDTPNELADIASETERLAAIDRRVDAIEAAKMAGARSAPGNREEDAPGAVKERVRIGVSRKKVGG